MPKKQPSAIFGRIYRRGNTAQSMANKAARLARPLSEKGPLRNKPEVHSVSVGQKNIGEWLVTTPELRRAGIRGAADLTHSTLSKLREKRRKLKGNTGQKSPNRPKKPR